MNIRTPELTDLPALQGLWQEAFGDTLEFIDTFFKTAFDCKRCFCVVDKNAVIAALYWFDCEYQGQPVAYLYAIATAETYQGQGLCHRLMEHTHRYLQKSGYLGAVLVPGNASLFQFYQSMGYQTCCYLEEFRCSTTDVLHQPAKTTHGSFHLHTITKTEYATLRKQLLPKDSVLQENICLDFLQTQVTLYAGEDFILAAHIEGQKLFAPELLGNNTNTEQILSALHCTEGFFRMPGTEKPFAMYLPLSENELTLPAYFGLAFD